MVRSKAKLNDKKLRNEANSYYNRAKNDLESSQNLAKIESGTEFGLNFLRQFDVGEERSRKLPKIFRFLQKYGPEAKRKTRTAGFKRCDYLVVTYCSFPFIFRLR